MLCWGTFLSLGILFSLLRTSGGAEHHRIHSGVQHDQLAQTLERLAIDKTVIVAEASCKYLDFADNWLMHIVKLGITNYIIVAMDDASLQYLDTKYAGHVIPVTVFEPGASMASQTFLEYGTEAFNNAMCQRLTHQQAVLAHGYWMLWSDLDTVWFQNMLDVIPRGFDWVGTDDDIDSMLRSSQKTTAPCGCLMFWAPSDEAKRIMQTWYESCTATTGHGDDQDAFKRLFSDGTLKEQLRWYVLPHQLFPSGGFNVHVDPQDAHAILPCGIHANWRRGDAAKQAFLKERQAWLIPDDHHFPTC